jgi:hypothetical protein
VANLWRGAFDGEECGGGERMKTIWQSIYGVCKCVAKAVGLIARAEARKPGKAAKKSVQGSTERQLERRRVRGGATGRGGRAWGGVRVRRVWGCWAGTGVV